MSKPVHEVRIGLIKAAVWHNMTRAGERYNVTISRLFRNGDLWKESNHFGRDDLLVAAKVLDLAHSWIYQQDRDRGTKFDEEANGAREPNLDRQS